MPSPSEVMAKMIRKLAGWLGLNADANVGAVIGFIVMAVVLAVGVVIL